MQKTLIGYSGFVGSTLLQQTDFTAQYRASTINDITKQPHDLVICAGAPAQKWLANRDPGADKLQIESLMGPLQQLRCNKFVLISTVDVFAQPNQVDETSPIETAGLQAYGLHRYQLEQSVQDRFSNALIIRLPGLVGVGLRKNALYDFKHHNNLDAIDTRHIFQFYPMAHLWRDISLALQQQLRLLHLTAAPLNIGAIAQEVFNITLMPKPDTQPLHYDMRTRFAQLFGAAEPYQYSADQSLAAIRHYAASAPLHTPQAQK